MNNYLFDQVLEKGYARIQEAAVLLDCCEQTVRRRIKDKTIESYKLPGEKPTRISADELVKYIQKRSK